MMKSATEIKFDNIIKQGFHEILKPLGFKKKGNNFYRRLPELGQIINIQKSVYYSKEHIHFTINTGIFLPEYWSVVSEGKDVPEYPTEPHCMIRERIGPLRGQGDTWYDLKSDTDEVEMIARMKADVEGYIIPHFNRFSSRADIVNQIDKPELHFSELAKIIILGELHFIDKARAEYEKLVLEDLPDGYRESIVSYARKYGII